MNIVLFHKDLRISDHQPLTEAAKIGEVLPLYVFEPSLWKETSFSVRHLQFVLESLEQLSRQIEVRGGKLFFAIGELELILDQLLANYDSISLFAHNNSSVVERTRHWAEKNNQSMLTYGLKDENVSSKIFKENLLAYLEDPLAEIPTRIDVPEGQPGCLFTDLKKLHNLQVKGCRIRFGQQGGEWRAIETLNSFFEGRFENYIANQHKPLSSSLSSSRLSAYITWGNISVRTVFQRTTDNLQSCELEEQKLQLEEFLSKLLMRVQICSRSGAEENQGNLGVIKGDWNEEWYQRWLHGRTGIPIIDASMRSLQKTGWLNFTLRSLVISFISNTLLLDSRQPSRALAEMYLDYEPAVHDFYVNQETGLTGKPKVVNPVKIGKLLDPDGTFIRRYAPQLCEVPEEYIHEPWLYPGFYQLGYEVPIVDVVKANKNAKLQFQRIMNKGKKTRKKKIADTEQLSFDL